PATGTYSQCLEPNSADRMLRRAAVGGCYPGGSADAARAELDADPWSRRPRGLGHGVLPGALAAAAHYDQVAVPEAVPQRAVIAASAGAGADVGPRPEQQRSRGAQRHDRDHCVLGASAPDGVPVP